MPAEAGKILRGQYPPFHAAGVVLAAGTGAAGAVPAKVGFTAYLQRAVFGITTVAAQAVLVRDTDGTPKVALSLPASAAIGTYSVDYGEQGLPMTPDKGIDIVNVAGPAYSYVLEGYYRQSSVLTLAQHQAS